MHLPRIMAALSLLALVPSARAEEEAPVQIRTPRVTLRSPGNREVRWRVRFERR